MPKLFLIDAYALIYASYYALINNPRINSKGQNTSAVYGFVNVLNDIIRNQQPTHVGVAFDPHGKTFRHKAYPEYKANRDSAPEDIHKAVPIIKDLLDAYRIPWFQVEGFEADDIIGTLAKQASNLGIETYMRTPDKDYAQLVDENVKMYRPRYGGGYEVLGVDEIKEKYNLSHPIQVIDMLALMGDKSDNIPGCPGIGEVIAPKLIAEFGSVENLVNSTDKLTGAMKKKVEANKEQIIFSKFLATIKTDAPVTLNLDQLAVKEPDEAKLSALLDELEFKSIKSRSVKDSKQSKKSSKSNSANTAEFAGEGTEGEKNSIFDGVELLGGECHVIENEEKLEEILRNNLTTPIFCFDFQTDQKSVFGAKIKKMDFCFDEKDFYRIEFEEKAAPVQQSLFDFFDQPAETQIEEKNDGKLRLDIINSFKKLFENPSVTKITWGIKYKKEVLKTNFGIDLCPTLFDTSIAHYLINPEVKIYDSEKTVCQLMQMMPLLVKKMEDREVKQLFDEVEMPLIEVLSDMELTGVRIDTAALQEISHTLTQRLEEIEKHVHELAGHQFNVGSPKQVAEVLYNELNLIEKKKPTDKLPSTSEDVLLKLRQKHPIVEEILNFRKLKKLIGTYVDALPRLVNPKTKRIHTTFNQTVTATGRLSSSDPNLQNIPVRGEDGKEIRKCFVPEPGCKFFSADYSQIELRVMAHLSQDEQMVRAFREGFDVHAATAARVYNKSIEDVTRDERTKAKRANFGIIYGISAWGLTESLNIDRKEAKALMDGYFETFPKVQEYMELSKEMAREKGYAETFMHRRRYLIDENDPEHSGINSSNHTVRSFAERNAINAPIQGSAADIIKVAMVKIFQRFKQENLRSKMILQVHDELNFSVVPEEQEIVEKIVLEEMQNAYPLSVPLVADSGWGENWLEAH